ncbi:NYN domain-containing protein [Nonomuraea sp. NPDC049419]|uniref:NYN domain-containing protein n=1 Tax=Nonomuraea sp. NPDC049419 TaxID=3155772 RepID=UPI0034227D12
MRDKPNGTGGRVGVYVDGFNLYYGLKGMSHHRDLWLDLAGLARDLLRDGQSLERVRYFTAIVRNDRQAAARQRVYLAAVQSQGVEVVLGRFQEKYNRCRQCGMVWRSYEEKKTDAAIASSMVADAALGVVDVVLLVSADTDLCAPIEKIRAIDERRGHKTRIVSVFPPGKGADGLRRCSDAWLPLGQALIRRWQLPEVVCGPDGIEYRRPAYWN